MYYVNIRMPTAVGRYIQFTYLHILYTIPKVRITVHVPSMNEVVYHFWERNASAFAKIVNIGSKEVNI